MRHVILRKEDFNEFISSIVQIQKVVAPVKRGFNNYSFQEVKSGDEIALNYIPTILPPKKYFLPQKENLIEFNGNENVYDAVLECEKMVLFGVHTCDLSGIQCLNLVFSEKPKDINYLVRKNKLIIIGFECTAYCDEHANCSMMKAHLPNGGYDLFFTELKDDFIVHINTTLGEELLEKTRLFTEAKHTHMEQLEAVREKKRETFKTDKAEFNINLHKLPELFDKVFDSKIWDDLEKRCVSCGNCTNVCPTCYCFTIEDNINLDLNSGVRTRTWDSCQNDTFAAVAGGESFREKRGARQRHRYFRKFKYPVDKYSRHFCTGCGRCTRTCMAKISMKETINALVDEQK